MAVTLWCIAGLVVVGVGLSYAIHLGSNAADRRSGTSTPAQVRMMPHGSSASGNSADSPTSELRTERSKMVMGTVTSFARPQAAVGRNAEKPGALTIRLANNETRDLILDGQTKVNSERGDDFASVKVGEVVVIEASELDGKLHARLIICGRITAGAPR